MIDNIILFYQQHHDDVCFFLILHEFQDRLLDKQLADSHDQLTAAASCGFSNDVLPHVICVAIKADAVQCSLLQREQKGTEAAALSDLVAAVLFVRSRNSQTKTQPSGSVFQTS